MSRKQGHHGGAWKVAYADFVTAMMALFLVLWLTAQDTKIKEAIERAFRNPFASVTKAAPGIIPNKEIPLSHSRGVTAFTASAIEMKWLRQLAQDVMRTLQQDQEETPSFKVETTDEGVRVSVFDRARKPIFEPDSTQLTDYGNWLFSTLAWEIARYSNLLIELEGHTESGRHMPRREYGIWELSADRANAARRKLLAHGVHSDQFRKVAGYADTQPFPDAPANDEVNNRVTVLLKLRSNGAS